MLDFKTLLLEQPLTHGRMIKSSVNCSLQVLTINQLFKLEFIKSLKMEISQVFEISLKKSDLIIVVSTCCFSSSLTCSVVCQNWGWEGGVVLNSKPQTFCCIIHSEGAIAFLRDVKSTPLKMRVAELTRVKGPDVLIKYNYVYTSISTMTSAFANSIYMLVEYAVWWDTSV